MHQTRKGNPWFFGMKAHGGVDRRTRLIHAVIATAANVHDATVLPDPLHDEETKMEGDSTYQGQPEVIQACAPNAQDLTSRRDRRKGIIGEAERARNRTKATVRAIVEHPFLAIERIFGFANTRHKGLEKLVDGLLEDGEGPPRSSAGP